MATGTADPFELPDFLKVTKDDAKRRRDAWKGKRLRWTREMNFTDPSDRAVQDPGTIRLLAERAAAEKALEKEKAKAREDSRIIGQKKRTHTLALKAALAETNQQLATDEGDDGMAKKAKKATKRAKLNPKLPSTHPANRGPKRRERQVTTRFKTSAPKARTELSKPRPPRAPRASKAHVVDAPIVLGKKGREALAAAGVKPGSMVDVTDQPKPAKAAKAAKVAKVKEPKAPKGESKAAKLEAMLRKGPVTLAEIAEQLGWLPHTTRAAISRVGFEVTTEKKDKVTTYHIAKDAAAKPAKSDAKSE